MPGDPASPMSFRLSSEDRRLVELVAAAKGLTTSEFTRQMVVGGARAIYEREGPDKLLAAVRESNDRLVQQRMELFEQITEHVSAKASGSPPR
jgi:uncharacterized protein (DUF1778 family)